MKNQSGYVAVVSILIIGIILIAVVSSVSFVNYFSNQGFLQSELKAQSFNAASACISLARAEALMSSAYPPVNTNLYLGLIGECSIISILPKDGFPKTIKAQGRYPPNQSKQAYTNLTVIIDSQNKIISQQEELNN